MLWIPSPYKLLLYDGNSITSFSEKDPIHNLDISDIQIFKPSSDGKFFIVSSDNQIHTFDPYKKSVIQSVRPDTMKYSSLAQTYSGENTGSLFLDHALVPDDDGGFYVLFKNNKGTEYYVFHSFKGADLKLFITLSIDGIPSMQYSNGYLFLAQANGVSVFDQDSNLVSSHDHLFIGDSSLPFLTKDPSGRIIVYQNCKSSSCPIYSYNFKEDSFDLFEYPPSLNMRNIHKVTMTENETWFMGVNKLIFYDHTTEKHEEIFNSISKQFKNLETIPLISHYTSVNQYDQGTIWLSSGYGLVKLEPKEDAVEVILKSNTELCNTFCSMRGMDVDESGNLWIASYSGVIKRSLTHELSKIKVLDNLLQDGVYSLNISGNHMMVNDILYNIKTGSYQILLPQKQNGHVTNISDANGDFWLASCYANGNYIAWYHHSIKEGLTTEIDLPTILQQAGQVTDMSLSDDQKSIWFTTANKGSFIFDIASKTFKSITPPDYWDQENIRHFCIYENNDHVYIGSSAALLKLNLNTDQIESYTLENISPDGTSYDRNYFSILPQDDKTLWLGTDNGVIGFDIEDSSFRSLTQLGMIAKEEFNRESFYKSPDGLLMFGSVNGIYIFDPKKLDLSNSNTARNINIISSQYLDGVTNRIIVDGVLGKTGITLDHDDKMLSFKIALPNYKKGQKAYFSYYLEGFNDIWSKASKENQINFSTLPPGDYILNVKGGYHQQDLNSQVLKIPISVDAAWYNLWYVRLLILLLLSGLISLIFIVRYNQIKKYETLRSDISQDLHDDVGSMLTGIAMQTELLELYVDDSIKPTAKKIALKSREAISKMRDTVWAIDASKDTSKDLKARILDYIYDTLEPLNITYNIKSNIKNNDQKLSPDIRQNVYLIAKESINNIAKHSNTKKIDLDLLLTKKEVVLSIKDHGREKKMKSSGQGLDNMKKRAISINADYSFTYQGDGYLTKLTVAL